MRSTMHHFTDGLGVAVLITLSLHDALPISLRRLQQWLRPERGRHRLPQRRQQPVTEIGRHTYELQSQSNLVCRLLLETKKRRWARRRPALRRNDEVDDAPLHRLPRRGLADR